MESFSTTVKNEILQLETKNKKCCMFSYLYGFLFCNQTEDDKYYIKTTNVENANSFLKTSGSKSSFGQFSINLTTIMSALKCRALS